VPFVKAIVRCPVVLAATVLMVVPLQAQPPATFDVVSIKPNKSGAAASETDTLPGRLNLINVTPLSLLLRAFGVMSVQIVGAPGWLSTERFDVVATIAGGVVLTEQSRQPLLQQMLSDRWRLRYHREQRSIPVYSLVASNEGSKLVTHRGAGEYAMKVEIAGPRRVLRSTRGNLSRLVEILSGATGRVVSNDTGLGGEYDFTLEWVQDASADDSGPSLFTALREQLGLRLVSAEKLAPVIVIDQIERPSDN
jgi:uncharacterized protein (TIGR03435 family)